MKPVSSLRVLGLYAASRVVTTALLAAAFLLAPLLHIPFGSTRARTGFLPFLSAWDGTAYRAIALHGYPETLPTDAAGHLVHNVWAFLPLYPAIVRGAMEVLGSSFDPTAIALSVLAGAGSAVLLHRLLLRTTSPRAALWGTILFCAGPLSFLLQVAYAESLFLMFVFGALLALRGDRLLPFAALAIAACATRPGGVVLVLALAVHVVVRWRDGWRPTRLRAAAVLLAAALVGVAGFAWPVIAGLVTGHPDAYTQTELSWWTGYVGRPAFIPFTPWFLMAVRYLSVAGAIVVLAVWGLGALILTRRSVRALGPEIHGFSIGHALYLAAVFLPQQSLPRLLLPLAPLLGAEPVTSTPARRGVLLALAITLQLPAIVLLWLIGYP
ncbi:MAG: hypothetical protein ABIP33_09835 [Pseudolysinimonas sp.]